LKYKPDPKMSVLDRRFLILLAVLMYILGFPRIVIGSIIVSLLILEYLFTLENQHVNGYYAYSELQELQELHHQGHYLRY
jgi:hypothetical protein